MLLSYKAKDTGLILSLGESADFDFYSGEKKWIKPLNL